jgi:ADP-ribose pyrophosphatase YjhB (NUDIX family)
MKKETKFKPRPGQVDFTNIRWAPVVNCVLKYKDKILIVKRSKSLRLYPGYWNGISGFLDDRKSLKEKILEELKEEIGLGEKHVISIRPGQIFDQEEPKYKKTWVVHPALVNVNTDKVKLSWEAKNYMWLTLREAKRLRLMPGFDLVLKIFFK